MHAYSSKFTGASPSGLRHRVLIPAFVGSNPTAPAIFNRLVGESMKAKEWIAKLVPLARNDAGAEEYQQLVQALTTECVEIFKVRLRNINTDWRRTSDERMIAAFREASVKWDAVVHGVQVELQGTPPFPLMRGALLLPHLTSLLEDIQNNRITHQSARAMQKFLVTAAERLGWNRFPYLHALFNMLDARLQSGASAQIKGYVESMQRYHHLRQRQAEGTLTPQELATIPQLEMWLINNRRETMSELNGMSPRQKLAAMLTMGALFG